MRIRERPNEVEILIFLFCDFCVPQEAPVDSLSPSCIIPQMPSMVVEFRSQDLSNRYLGVVSS